MPSLFFGFEAPLATEEQEVSFAVLAGVEDLMNLLLGAFGDHFFEAEPELGFDEAVGGEGKFGLKKR